MMRVSRREILAENRQLWADKRRLVVERDDAREQAAADRARARVAERRAEEAEAETARLAGELAAQKAVNDNLADRLMQSMGYSDAALRVLGVEPLEPAASEPGEVAS